MEKVGLFNTLAKRDLVIALIVVIGLFSISSLHDLGEFWAVWVGGHENWELDNVPIALAMGSVVFFWYACRRWWDSCHEVQAHSITNEQLNQKIIEHEQAVQVLKRNEQTLIQNDLELNLAKLQLEKIAYFDGLTGLANRVHAQKDLAELFKRKPLDKKFAIIQVDLDNFKRVNDTLGHAAGDILLKGLGQRLISISRHIDNIRPYRWGGDEFLLIIDHRDDINLESLCEELTDLISIPLQISKTTIRPTVSLGAARYPEDAKDLENLMIYSDHALYKTKEQGRDGFHVFTPDMKEQIEAEHRIEKELRVAIDTGQLELYFQPQIDNVDERVTGLEALLRWNHPERGLLSPGAFLSIIESSSMAPAVGRIVFDLAMVAIRQWVDQGLDFGRLSINLSPEHLNKNSVIEDLFSAMDKHGVLPEYLSVEFLESYLFDDTNANIRSVLEKLRDRDIHVELDDFGTGYASLSHLSKLPITGLKIDRSFIHQMDHDTTREGIVAALHSISKLMKLRMVCEGIETTQQVNTIARIGECAIQGYFVAKPMSFEDITQWIENKENIGSLIPVQQDFLKST